MIKEYFKIAIKNLKTRSLRSWLTILGIVIGVFLIIMIISLSEGLKGAVLSQLSQVGKDIIFIFPGQIDNLMTAFAGGSKLSEDDMKAIGKASGVEQVMPVVYQVEVVKHSGVGKMVMITGIPWRQSLSLVEDDMGWSIKDGRWPESGKKEVAIGNMVATNIFPEIELGTFANIEGRQFEIVGIMKSTGNKQDDSMIMMDLELYRDVTGDRKGAQSAVAKVGNGYLVNETADNIKAELEKTRKRHAGSDDTLPFSVLTSEKAGEIVSSIMAIIQIVILGFASIAVIVGGVGIMNTMFTSVRERTKEIGILKAIGATNKTINMIFLFEAGTIGLIGGIGGTILGATCAKLIEVYAQLNQVFYLKASVGLPLIIFGLSFSFIIGCLSGFVPARRAAQLKPVDALRYE